MKHQKSFENGVIVLFLTMLFQGEYCSHKCINGNIFYFSFGMVFGVSVYLLCTDKHITIIIIIIKLYL